MSHRQRASRSVVAAALLAGVLGTGAAVAPTAHADATQRAIVAGAEPSWVSSATVLGAVPTAQVLNARVYLASRDAAGLAAYATSVSEPTSASYGQYLTPAEVQARFGPDPDQVSAVSDWLTSAGLQVTASTEHYLEVKGDAAAMQTTFGTQLDNVTLDGQDYRTPVSPVSVPASLGSAVLAVTGLDNAGDRAVSQLDTGAPAASDSAATMADAPMNSTGASEDGFSPSRTVNPTNAPPAPVFNNSGPSSTFYGQNVDTKLPSAFGSQQAFAVQGYTGTQFRAAYGATPGETGAGVKVAVIDAYDSPTLVADTQQYANNEGVPWTPGQLTQVTPTTYSDLTSCQASASWFQEQPLDVEAVHAIAPAADVVAVSAASCDNDDMFDGIADIIDNHLADILSGSIGFIDRVTTAQRATFDQVFQEAAAEGIGLFFASGDGSDLNGTDGGHKDFPDFDPFVTVVGGTSLAVGANNTYLFETGWGTHTATLSADGTSWGTLPGALGSGTGGGAIKHVAQPAYQAGVVPASISTPAGVTSPRRVTPDISADADPTTGMLIGYTQQFPDGTVEYLQNRTGGTSLATPLVAGLQAIAEQLAGHPLGFANPEIYAKFGTSDFHDPNGNPLGNGQPAAQVRTDFVNSADDTDGTVTTLRTDGADDLLTTTPGYDDTTGVGTPNAAYLQSFASH
jgi:subtilase family serine protease